MSQQDIIVEQVFPHAPDIIWKALTTGALIARWLHMPVVGFEPAVGRQFTFQTTPAGQWDGIIRCEVLEVVPPERLVYAWRGGHESNIGYGARLDSVVTFTVTKEAQGTRLRVVHSGFLLPKNETAFRNMSGGWKKVVRDIGAVASDE